MGLYPYVKFFNIAMSKFAKLDGQEMVVESTLQDMQAVEENTIIETIKNAEWLMPGLAAAVVIGGINVVYGFARHVAYELGDTVGKKVRNTMNKMELKKFIRALNSDDVKLFLKGQCDAAFEEAKKKYPDLTKKVSAVDGTAVEKGTDAVKSSKGFFGKFFHSTNITPVKIGEYLIVFDGTPSSGVSTTVVVFQDMKTKQYVCCVLSSPTLPAA